MRPTIEAPTTRTMPPTGRKTEAVKMWAAVGAAFLSLEVYVITRWVLSDDFGTIPAGPTPMSGWDRAWSIIWQVSGVALLVGFIGWFVIRPWRREGRLSLDGLLVLCFSLIEWQDPWCNYIKDWGTYNTHLIQFGSWTKQIPGWMSPNGNRFAEPLLVMVPIYVWAVFGMTILGCWALRRVKTQWPQLGTVGLVTVAYGMFVVVDFVLEALWMRTGIWAYPGGGPLYVFFEGSRYQFPIHESLLWGAAWAGFTCLRFFRDDKGYTIAERGIDDVKATAAQKTGLRFLALFGAINILYLVLYNVPAMLVAAHGQSWSHGVEKVSYMNDYLCGEGTTYACADKSTPIPWGHSNHVRPDGQLIPNDAEPPIPLGIK